MQNVRQVSRIVGYSRRPGAKPTLGVYGPHQLVEELPLRFVLLRILPFDFEDKQFAAGQPNEIVRPKSLDDALEHVQNLEFQMIILGPPGDVGVAVELEGLARFPTGIEYTQVNV